MMPGQGPYMRAVLRRCIIESCSELEDITAVSERALDTITDIVLDCERL